MKKLIGMLLALTMAVCSALPAYGEEAPALSAQAVILIEAESGDVLYERNGDEQMLIASTTKILTALVVLERCDPEQSVVIQPEWTGIEGSSMYLAPGQELTVRELLYGLMLASGNDAAVALACVTAGSVEEFAALMNEKAQALGCENARFENPNGLDAEGHHASARDLALITREAIRNDTFCEIVSCESRTVGELTFTNHNRLLRECEGVFGVKTGYTMAAGRTLVTCCERDGLKLICVTLSAPDDWNDHKTLYDWAYGQWTRVAATGTEMEWTVPVIGGLQPEVAVSPAEELSLFCRAGETVTLTVELPTFVYASVTEGETAGRAVAWVDGEERASVPLVFRAGVEKISEEEPTLWEKINALFR